MKNEITCPQCESENIYADGSLWICPDCAHEWSAHDVKSASTVASRNQIVKDAFGNILIDGDSVTVIKELKIKGASSVVKVGSKVKNIRIVESDDGHNIACRIEGVGAINLKSEFVKKA